MQFENDDLNQKIMLFENELAEKENLESQLAGKNNEIVRLERTLTETQIVRDISELRQKLFRKKTF